MGEDRYLIALCGDKIGYTRNCHFQGDVLILVVDDSRYTQWVPMALGTLHIDRTLDLVTDEEIEHLSTVWRRGRLSMLLTIKSSWLMESNAVIFNLDQVRGDVKLTKTIMLKPFESTHVSGLSKVKGYYKRVHTITEPFSQLLSKYVSMATAFVTMDANLGRVSIALRNILARAVKIMAGTKIVRVGAANLIPSTLVPKDCNLPMMHRCQ